MSENDYILVFWYKENGKWSVQSIKNIISPRKEYPSYGVEFVTVMYKKNPYPGLLVEIAGDKKSLELRGKGVWDALEEHRTLRKALTAKGIAADHLDERADEDIDVHADDEENKASGESNNNGKNTKENKENADKSVVKAKGTKRQIKENPEEGKKRKIEDKEKEAEIKKKEKENAKKEKEEKKRQDEEKKAAKEQEKTTAMARHREYLAQLDNFSNEEPINSSVLSEDGDTFDRDIVSDIMDTSMETSVELMSLLPSPIVPYGGARSTVAMKCPRVKQPEPDICTDCIVWQVKLEEANQEIQRLKAMLDNGERADGNSGIVMGDLYAEKPRPGLVSEEKAKKNNMVELVPQSGIYVYPKHIREAERKENGKKMARFLLSCFYTATELIMAGNLTGVNGKKGLKMEILDAIIGYCLQSDRTVSAADLRTAMRNKMTAHTCERKRKDKKTKNGNKVDASKELHEHASEAAPHKHATEAAANEHIDDATIPVVTNTNVVD